ncbi:MAG: 4Fe-4S binding protein [bacterium]|nr:4Fe-4S binding protein [bacterium]
MAYKISDECVQCGTCVDTCPVGAIKEENENFLFIDQNGCTKCGTCVNECPIGAINEE